LITNRFILARHDIYTDIFHQALNFLVELNYVIFHVVGIDYISSENYFADILEFLAVLSRGKVPENVLEKSVEIRVFLKI
jgi:hypothetical protein